MTSADRPLSIDPDERRREQQRQRARRHRRRERENLQNLNLDVPCVTINRLIDDGYLELEHAGDRPDRWGAAGPRPSSLGLD